MEEKMVHDDSPPWLSDRRGLGSKALSYLNATTQLLTHADGQTLTGPLQDTKGQIKLVSSTLKTDHTFYLPTVLLRITITKY